MGCRQDPEVADQGPAAEVEIRSVPTPQAGLPGELQGGGVLAVQDADLKGLVFYSARALQKRKKKMLHIEKMIMRFFHTKWTCSRAGAGVASSLTFTPTTRHMTLMLDGRNQGGGRYSIAIAAG